MNPYQMPVVCSVCGGEGMAWVGRGHPWFDTFTHQDPMVCEVVLDTKCRKEARAKKQEDERLDNFFGGR